MRHTARLLAVFAVAVLMLSGMGVSAAAGINQWTTNGPCGGDIQSVAVSPNYVSDHTVYAGTNGGGAFKSTDEGANWTAVNVGLLHKMIVSLAVSPAYATDHTVYTGTYGGVYKSTDEGASWSAASAGISNSTIRSLAVSPAYASDHTVYAGTNGGVFKTTDGGTNWTAVNTGITNLQILSLAVSPAYASDQTVYAGTNGGGVYKTTNRGTGWTAVNTCLINPYVYSLAVSPAFASDQTVYAGTNGSGVYKTTNGGTGWTAVNTGIIYKGIKSLALSPDYALDRTVYAGTWVGGVYKTTDGGTNWTTVNDGIIKTNGIWSLAVSPNYTADQTIYAGVTGGVLKSTDGGTGWAAVNNGITNATIWSLAVSPDYTADQTVFAGTNGGGVLRSTDGGATWTAVNAGITNSSIMSLAVSPDYALDRTVYAGTGGDGVFKSTDGGTNWTCANISGTICSLAVSPAFASDQTIYAGIWGAGVVRSTDGGASWYNANSGITNTNIQSVAVSSDYASDQTVYAGTNGDGMFKSTDGGANWTVVNNGITSTAMWSLAVSPDYAADQTVYAGTVDNGVFKTTDGGTNWAAVITGITSNDITSLAVSPNYATDRTVYAGMPGGVFKSTDGGANWTVLSVGITNVDIRSLAVSPAYASDQTVYTGTYGGGVFRYTTEDTTPPASAVTSPNDGATFSGFSFTITGTASDGIGSGIQKVEVGITPDGGSTTWVQAAGTTSWSYDWAMPANGLYTIIAVATDNAGYTETPGAGVTVTVYNAPHCSDGVQDADETGVDCGGVDCQACPPPPDAHCHNGFQDADETGVDCGGADCQACATTPPVAPTGLYVEDIHECGKLRATWMASPDFDLSGYTLYIGTTDACDDIAPKSLSSDVTEYTFTDLQNGVKYYVKMVARDIDGNVSAPSAVVSTGVNTTGRGTNDTTPNPDDPQGAVTDLAATPGEGMVTITWTKHADRDVVGYRVFRKKYDGTGFSVDKVSSSAAYPPVFTSAALYYSLFPDSEFAGKVVKSENTYTFVDNDRLIGCVEYDYLVIPINCDTSLVSSYAPSVYARVHGDGTKPRDNTAPAAPQSLVAVAGSHKVYLIWTNPYNDDFAHVSLRRSMSGFPATKYDGVDVFAANGLDPAAYAAKGQTNILVDNNTNCVSYYYTVFCEDMCDNISSRRCSNTAGGPEAATAPCGDGIPDSNEYGPPPAPSTSSYALAYCFNADSPTTTLHWADPTSNTNSTESPLPPAPDDIVGYNVYRAEPDTYSMVASHPTGLNPYNEYSDTQVLADGGIYKYYVRTVDCTDKESLDFDAAGHNNKVEMTAFPGRVAYDTSQPTTAFNTYHNGIKFYTKNTSAHEALISGMTVSWSGNSTETNAKLTWVAYFNGSTWVNLFGNSSNTVGISAGSYVMFPDNTKIAQATSPTTPMSAQFKFLWRTTTGGQDATVDMRDVTIQILYDYRLYYYSSYTGSFVESNPEAAWAGCTAITYLLTKPTVATVAITSPTEGATVSADTAIQVQAASTGNGITSVQVRIDGDAWQSCTLVGSYWQYVWNLTLNGDHTIEAIGYAGAVSGASAVRHVTVQKLPQIVASFASPASGATLSGTTPISIHAQETSGAGNVINSVTVSIDGGAATACPMTSGTNTDGYWGYSWDIVPLANGSHTIAATVTSGVTTSTISNTVTVNNPPAQLDSLMPSPPSPSFVNNEVVWTAIAGGGSGSYQFKYLLRDPAGVWTTVKDYTEPGNIWNWTPTAPGKYQVVCYVRNAGSAASYESYLNSGWYTVNPLPAVLASLTPSPSSPSVVNNMVTWTATGSGGSGSYEFKFMLRDPAGVWTTVKDYTVPGNTWDWTPSITGKYQVVCYVRNAGSTASYDAYLNSGWYTVNWTPAQMATLAPDVVSPALINFGMGSTLVTWTATATGGSGSYEFKFLLRNPAGAWSTVKDYAIPGNTFSWVPSVVGKYQVVCYVRNAGSTAAYEGYINFGWYEVKYGKAQLASFNPFPLSPSIAGNMVTWTATGSGGSGSYEFKILLRNTLGVWSTVKDYGVPGNSWDWTPATIGKYQVVCYIRNQGSTVAYDAYINSGWYTVK